MTSPRYIEGADECDAKMALTAEAVSALRKRLLSRRLLGAEPTRKAGRANFVTTEDEAIQEYLERVLLKIDDAGILAAEESSPGDSASRDGSGWIIDPIDGTTNFVHGYPAYAISVAHATECVVDFAVVYEPFLDETFTARRGGGTRLNGTDIAPASTSYLRDALVGTGIPYDVNRLDVFGRLASYLARNTHGYRVKGPAALDLCYVACGRLDGYAEFDLQPWDYAAGGLIVEEAGGLVTLVDTTPNRLVQSSVVASTATLHTALVDALSGAI